MKKRMVVVLTAVLSISAVSVFVIVGNAISDNKVVFSTEPVTVSVTKEEIIAVDGNEFMNKYYIEIRSKYAKNNNEEHDLLIDELYAEIDEFYNNIKTGVTQSEYNSYESSINSIIEKIESDGKSDLSEETTMTKEALVRRIDVLLVEEIEQKILQIEYSDRKDKTKEERKAPFEELLVEAENLMDDIENGIVSVEDGEKIYNKLTREYYSAQSID